MMFSSSNCCCYGWAAAVRAGSSTLQVCELSPKLKCPPYLQRHMIKPRYVFPRPFQVKPVSPSASLEDSSFHKARPAREGGDGALTLPQDGANTKAVAHLMFWVSLLLQTNILIPQLDLN